MVSGSGVVNIVWVIVFVIVVVLFLKSIKIIQPFEKGVVERFGGYRRIINPGINFIIPFIETCKVVDMREFVVNLNDQEFITKNNLKLSVDVVIHFKVIDPYKILYNVVGLESSMTKLIGSLLDEIIGGVSDDNLSTIKIEVKNRLFSKLEKNIYNWGIKLIHIGVNRLELVKEP